jgi:hypothetical protein
MPQSSELSRFFVLCLYILITPLLQVDAIPMKVVGQLPFPRAASVVVQVFNEFG